MQDVQQELGLKRSAEDIEVHCACICALLEYSAVVTITCTSMGRARAIGVARLMRVLVASATSCILRHTHDKVATPKHTLTSVGHLQR